MVFIKIKLLKWAPFNISLNHFPIYRFTNVINFEIFCKIIKIISNYPETISDHIVIHSNETITKISVELCPIAIYNNSDMKINIIVNLKLIALEYILTSYAAFLILLCKL